MPQIGLGTACLKEEVCVQAVEDAISMGACPRKRRNFRNFREF